MLRKILIALLCLVVAGVSSWLRFGDLGAAKRWLAGLTVPSLAVQAPPAPASNEADLPQHQAFSGTVASPRTGMLVLHFRRADGADDLTAKGVIQVFGSDGGMLKEMSAWGGFRRETPAGASMVRFVVGSLPAGSYRVTVDLGAAQPLGIKRAALEFASGGADPIWGELAKGK